MKNLLIAIVFLATMGCGEESPELKKEYLKAAAWVMSNELVKTKIRTPATAQFPTMTDSDIMALGDSTFIINSYVDAENAFGAHIRTGYYCELTYKGGDEDSTENWEVVKCYLKE